MKDSSIPNNSLICVNHSVALCVASVSICVTNNYTERHRERRRDTEKAQPIKRRKMACKVVVGEVIAGDSTVILIQLYNWNLMPKEGKIEIPS